MASEVVFLTMPSRNQKKRSKQRAEYLQKQDENKAKARALYKPIPKRRRPLYATATTQILNLSDLLKGGDMKRTSRRTVLLKGGYMKRTSRRTALLTGRNTRTIQLPLKHLKRVGIGMTPLPRGRGTAGVTALPLPPKGMLWHVVLTLKSCVCNICRAWSGGFWSGLSPYYLTKRGSRARTTMYSTDLHKTIHFTCKACNCVYSSSVYCFNLI